MSPAKPSQSPSGTPTRAQLAQAASGALVAAAGQLRADLTSRTRHRVLLDVLAVDVEAFADWLDGRAWLLGVDPGALDELLAVDDLAQRQVAVDDELVPLDDAPAVQLADPEQAAALTAALRCGRPTAGGGSCDGCNGLHVPTCEVWLLRGLAL